MESSMVTLDQAIDTVMQLPAEQRVILLEILQNRQIEALRLEIAADAQESLAAFRRGELSARPAADVVVELREALEGEE